MGKWITIDGTHVYIGEDGKIEKGPPDLAGKKINHISDADRVHAALHHHHDKGGLSREDVSNHLGMSHEQAGKALEQLQKDKRLDTSTEKYKAKGQPSDVAKKAHEDEQFQRNVFLDELMHGSSKFGKDIKKAEDNRDWWAARDLRRQEHRKHLEDFNNLPSAELTQPNKLGPGYASRFKHIRDDEWAEAVADNMVVHRNHEYVRDQFKGNLEGYQTPEGDKWESINEGREKFTDNLALNSPEDSKAFKALYVNGNGELKAEKDKGFIKIASENGYNFLFDSLTTDEKTAKKGMVTWKPINDSLAVVFDANRMQWGIAKRSTFEK